MMVPYAVFAVGGLFLSGITWAGVATGLAEERRRQQAHLERAQLEQS
jgi:hypothetical protein